MSTRTPNRLIHETSPYLLQHAHNPVDWYPWGEEAFQKARKEDKPVFLSVGYSSCHWCHVMERESFEDEGIAAVLNRDFISVKVDREERPDVDHIYMNACLAMTGSGGWPLTLFLTPDKKPFFAGTYFPRDSRRGYAGFATVLERVANSWKNNRKYLENSSVRILSHIDERPEMSRKNDLGSLFGIRRSAMSRLTREAAQALMDIYDSRWGGFGSSPKFPSPHTLMFLMRFAEDAPMDSAIWSAVRHTLSAMSQGGIHDHAGGGFHRYSTDRMWLVPHFEKMLYDNAMLCMAYTECYEKTGEFAHIPREIIAYVMREMSDPRGCFYTAQDAVSEGVEGSYYCWTPSEIKAVLGEREGARFCFLYDVTVNGNFEGTNILNLIRMPVGGDDLSFASIALPGLLEARNKRAAPLRDEKVLLTSNALMAAALAKAGRALEERSYTLAAERCAAFLLKHMQIGEALSAVYGKDIPATLDGYAYLVWALLEIYRSTLNSRWLDEARVVGGLIAGTFFGEDGLLYYTSPDSTDLPLRGINAQDGAVPSGQSVAAHCFTILSRLTGDAYWDEWLNDLLNGLSPSLKKAPEAHTWMMAALLHIDRGGTDITLTPGYGLENLVAELRGFHPFMTVRLDEERSDGRAAAYVCSNSTCMAPVEDAAALRGIISSVSAATIPG